MKRVSWTPTTSWARLFIRAALDGAPPSGPPEATREELERREREAAYLLVLVLVALGGNTRLARDGC